jgi:transcriptional regulator with XRE-family HTH domain
MRAGDLIYLARARAGMTQAELGERAGVAQNAVSRIERGQIDPGFATVVALVRACGFEPEMSFAAHDSSYVRDVRRRLTLTPRERLDIAVDLAQATQRAALAGAGVSRSSEGTA